MIALAWPVYASTASTGGTRAQAIPYPVPEIDPVAAEERIVWLEGCGLDIARRSRSLRRRVRTKPWIAPDDLARATAEIQIEITSRDDEVTMWTRQLRPWWIRWWPW